MKSAAAVIICLFIPGCGAGADPDPAQERTQAQRDSAIAESGLPGAGAVGRALETSDSAAARAARMDTFR